MTTRDNEVQLPRAAALQTTESIRAARQRTQEQAEATLRQQANLLNLTHDSIFVRDMDGSVIKYWNRAAEELYGWRAEHAIGKVAHELLKTVFPAPLDEIQAELLAAGRWEGELLHTTRDGAQVAVASRWSLQRNDHGAPLAILETNNDITERKRAEEARRHSEEQWRAAFECNPTMYFILDAAGTIASVNLFGAQQLGYTVGELIGQSVLMVFHPADREFIQRQAAACFDEPGRMRQWEAHKIRKDGTMLWVRETANSVVLRNQQVLLVVCEDITEQKRAEEAARQSERELRDVIESIPAMVWTARPDGSNSFVNKRWEEYTGVTFEQTSGLGWVPVLHPDDIHGYVDAWLRSVEHGERFEHEVRFRRAADGEYRWFRSQGVPLRDEQGRIVKWFGVVTDVEDRKRAEALLAGEKRILEMVAKGDSLGEILDSLCRLVEEQEASGVLASILLLDGDQLRHGSAPSLPEAYTAAIDGVRIGPSVGSCGTAAYLARQVIVEDIATDPLWVDYRTAALPHSLRACWSTPIFSSASKVIATFAMYYRQPRRPTERDHEIIEQITHLAGVAIERKLTYDELQRSRTYLAEAQRLTHTGSWALRTGSNTISYWSEENFRVWDFEPQQGLPTSD
ncbi:MAG TPA: PAS domain S-box protein, partial [Vicinamibacterales bacterium]